MMDNKSGSGKYGILLSIIAWGAVWGIFEATVGYLLHLVSFGYSWLVWYPVACFFMANVYRDTGRMMSVFYVGALGSSIKLLNLLLPGRIDKVINPAVSILFEAAIFTAVIFAFSRLPEKAGKNPFIKGISALIMNSGWRLLYILYLLFMVPGWMRDISVVSSAEKFIPFFITQNLFTSALVFLGYQFKEYLFKPVIFVEGKVSKLYDAAPKELAPFLKVALPVFMLFLNIALQMALK